MKLNRKFKKIVGIAFRVTSIVFILGCIVFYGLRCIKYYKISNPKTVKIEGLVSIEIPKKSTIVTNGEGMYHLNGYYVYKGNVNDNYLLFSSKIFRIIKMRYGGNVQLILDEPATELYWNKTLTTFDKSNVYNYLNDYYLKSINKEMLAKQTICLDEFSSVSVKECKNFVEDYVSLIDISTFLNIKEEENYIASEDELVWLSNYTSENVWHIEGNNIATGNPDNFYSIKPVVMLDYSVNLLGGNGTINDPYRVDEVKKDNESKIVKLGNDLWTIIEQKDNKIKLALNETLDKMYSFSLKALKFDPSEENSLANYLNTEYYESLTYKDLILDNEWNVGFYDGNYKNIMDTKITSKVGLLSLLDKKTINDSEYYLINNNNESVYTYSDAINLSKKTYSKKIKPCIVIDLKNLTKGSGTINDPLRMGE